MKLTSKQREGAKVTRHHDQPTTPCDRLLASPQLGDQAKATLKAHRAKLNPLTLSRQVETQLKAVWHTSRPTDSLRADGRHPMIPPVPSIVRQLPRLLQPPPVSFSFNATGYKTKKSRVKRAAGALKTQSVPKVRIYEFYQRISFI
jgi:hypothetical protein